jgi:putative sigma-54 modulation protein
MATNWFQFVCQICIPRRFFSPFSTKIGRLFLDLFAKTLHISNMKFIVTPHKLTLTKAIEDHILGKIEKIEHLDKNATSARVAVDHDKTKAPDKQFSCSVLLTMPGQEIFADDSQADLYTAIDLVCKKLQQQLRKRHGKDKAIKHTEGAKGKEDTRTAAAPEE